MKQKDSDYRSNIDTYLETRGVRLEDVIASAKIAPGAPLVFGGSVAEGFGNPDSDIDLLTVSTEQDSSLSIVEEDCTISTVMLEGSVEISIEHYNPSIVYRLETLMREVDAALSNPSTVDKMPTITAMSDLRFLHRLRTSLPLIAEAEVTTLRDRLHLDRLGEFVALMNIKLHFAHREDALAEFDQGELASSSWCIRSATSALAGAFLANLGHTHHNDRWRVRLLQSSIKSSSEASSFLKFLTGEPVQTKEEFGEWLAFSDSIFAHLATDCPTLLPVFARVSAAFPIRMN